MPIAEDIRAAIDKNLSAEIGTSLLTRLQHAEDDAAALVGLRANLQRAQDHIAELEKKLAAHKGLDERMHVLLTKESEVDQKLLRAELYELRVKSSDEKVALMRSVVQDVFANSRFKYTVTEGGMLPASPGPTGMFPQSVPYSRTATGEGENMPPPPPTAPGHS